MSVDVSQPRVGAVIVIYEHGLLGEGIAALLRDDGFEASIFDRCELAAIAVALTAHPAVVIAEQTTPECGRLIAEVSPGSRVVDVSKVIGRGCQEPSDIVDFGAILAALHAD